MTLVAATPHHAAAMALIHARAFPPGERWGAEAMALQLAMPGAYGWLLCPLSPRERAGVREAASAGSVPKRARETHGAALAASLTQALVRFTAQARREREQEAGGFVLARVVADEAEILTLAVDPHGQGQGAGRLLLQAAMGEARRRGAVAMFLEVAPSNAAALALYGSAGFVQVGRRPRYYPGGSDALVLRGPLNPGAAAEAACRPSQE